MNRFENIGIIKNEPIYDGAKLEYFLSEIGSMRSMAKWGKPRIVNLFNHMIPDFAHKETGRYLDQRM